MRRKSSLFLPFPSRSLSGAKRKIVQGERNEKEKLAFPSISEAQPVCTQTKTRRRGSPPRRDAVHRVSPARGAAPPRHSFSAVGHSAVWAPGKAPLLRLLVAQAGRNVAAEGRPRRGRANSSLGWSAAEPEVGAAEKMSASKRSPCPLRHMACTPLRGCTRGVRAYRGFRCAPPAATDRSAPLGPSLRRRCCLRRGGFLAAHSSGCQPRYDILLSAWLLRARGAADASRHVGPKFRPAPRCALFGKPLKRTAWLSAF